jgi:tetratricopeptide (TPR) repeat protein
MQISRQISIASIPNALVKWLRVWLIFSFVCAAGAQAGPSERVISSEIQFAYAQSLFQDKDFSTAEVEFKRFIHFFPTDPRVAEAMFKTGMALFYQEKFHEAARRFNDLILGDPDMASPYTQEAFFMQSRSFKNLGNMGYARVVLENFLKLTQNMDTQENIYLKLAELHIEISRKPGMDELDSALTCLERISPDSSLASQKNELIQRIMDVRSLTEKKPALAGALGFIPGGGFLYTGRVHDAAAAFILNTGLGLAAWKAFDQHNPALGSVIALAGSGFYIGGIYGGITAAHKYNHAQKLRILDRTFSFNTGFDLNAKSVFFSFSQGF